jgi:predicted amidohydrolase
MATPLRSVRVATAQFYSDDNIPTSTETCVQYMRQAKKEGVKLIVFPENANRCRDFTTPDEAWEKLESLEDNAFIAGLQAAAKEMQMIIVAGVDIRGETKPTCHIGQVIISEKGAVLDTHLKTVLWDYEYTIFTPGSKEIEVTQTSVGKIGLLMCADGIVPEVPRISALKGAEMLCNSLNSRGPDELRVHEPLRAIENHVWVRLYPPMYTTICGNRGNPGWGLTKNIDDSIEHGGWARRCLPLDRRLPDRFTKRRRPRLRRRNARGNGMGRNHAIHVLSQVSRWWHRVTPGLSTARSVYRTR